MADIKNIKERRPVIYLHNNDKADALIRAGGFQNDTQLINYLIEATGIEQITKITMTDPKTKKSISIIRSSNYDPKQW